MKEFRVKRVYDSPASSDGTRILVDRLWPRGLQKQSARLGEWLKEVAPTDSLRRWFGHDPVSVEGVQTVLLRRIGREAQRMGRRPGARTERQASWRTIGCMRGLFAGTIRSVVRRDPPYPRSTWGHRGKIIHYSENASWRMVV